MGSEIQPSSFPATLGALALGEEESLCQLLPARSGSMPNINHLSAKGPKSLLPGENSEMLSCESGWSSVTNFPFQLPLTAPQLGVSARPRLRPSNRAQAFPCAFSVVALGNIAVLQGGPSQINRSSFHGSGTVQRAMGEWGHVCWEWSDMAT